MPPEWAAYTYTGDSSYQTSFESDQPLCTPTYACSASPALPSGGDLCAFTDADSVAMSYKTEYSQAVEWGFNGDMSDRITMTEVPPGTYTITMSATIPSGPTTMSNTFSITFVDPCPSTVPTGQWASLSSPVLYRINDPALTDTATMTDTVSTSHSP